MLPRVGWGGVALRRARTCARAAVPAGWPSGRFDLVRAAATARRTHIRSLARSMEVWRARVSLLPARCRARDRGAEIGRVDARLADDTAAVATRRDGDGLRYEPR